MYHSRRHESGFTLIEALSQLLLLGIFTHLILFLVSEYFGLLSIKEQRIEADWEICITDMNQYFTINSFIQLSDDGFAVAVTHNDQKYHILFMNQTLWKHEKGGNETLLTGLKHAQFSLNGNELSLTAKLENGIEKERIFIVATFTE